MKKKRNVLLTSIVIAVLVLVALAIPGPFDDALIAGVGFYGAQKGWF